MKRFGQVNVKIMDIKNCHCTYIVYVLNPVGYFSTFPFQIENVANLHSSPYEKKLVHSKIFVCFVINKK